MKGKPRHHLMLADVLAILLPIAVIVIFVVDYLAQPR